MATCANPYCDETVQRTGTRCPTCAHYNKLAKQRERRNSTPDPLAEAIDDAVEELKQTVEINDKRLKELIRINCQGKLQNIKDRVTAGGHVGPDDTHYAAHFALQLHHILNETNNQNQATLRQLQLWAERYNPKT